MKTNELKIEYMPIEDLTPYINNAKIHTPEQIEQIKHSINEFGMNDPIGIWSKDNIIVEGHGRLMACKELGFETVPVIRLDNLTDEQRKAYTLIHNQTTMNTGFDIDILNEELQNIDLDLSDFGFEIELDDIEEEKEIVEDEVPEVPDEPKAKYGDIYILGNHVLMCGDSTKAEDVEKLMRGGYSLTPTAPPVTADMVFTDPPYGMSLDTDFSDMKSRSGTDFQKRKMQGKKYKNVIGDNDDFKKELITTIFDNLGYCNEIFIWGADYYAEIIPNRNNGSWFVWDKRSNENDDIEILEAMDKIYGSCFELCYSKNKHKRDIVRIRWAGLYGMEKDDTKKRVHPTQKPSILAQWFIKKYSKENQVIVDIYGGSGSTLIACEQLNRKCYMMELDPHYIDVIIQRWENFTGKKAVKING